VWYGYTALTDTGVAGRCSILTEPAITSMQGKRKSRAAFDRLPGNSFTTPLAECRNAPDRGTKGVKGYFFFISLRIVIPFLRWAKTTCRSLRT